VATVVAQGTIKGSTKAHKPKWVLSAAAKRRIAAAQRKRWKAFHAVHDLAKARAAKAAKASAPTA